MPGPVTQPLFDAAKKYAIGFSIGYAELVMERDETGTKRLRRFNTSILVNHQGDIVLKYRKIHLPGHAEYDPNRTAQHLEKRYFEVGNLGFPVIRAPMGNLSGINMGMMICNDRRWPEAWRVLGLQGVELVTLGYNTPSSNTSGVGYEAPHLRVQHSHMSVQSGAYQNATFAVACAKGGREDGFDMIGHSVIASPQGEIMAQATTAGDELITADCDLDLVQFGRKTVFNFESHRRPEAYARITEQVGATEPDVWSRDCITAPGRTRMYDKPLG
jgi:predicted amidohydrolase